MTRNETAGVGAIGHTSEREGIYTQTRKCVLIWRRGKSRNVANAIGVKWRQRLKISAS